MEAQPRQIQRYVTFEGGILPYRDYLIQDLKDPIHAAGYIEAILEEKDPEPNLLKAALQDVAESLGNEQHLAKLDRILSIEGSILIQILSILVKFKLATLITSEISFNSKDKLRRIK